MQTCVLCRHACGVQVHLQQADVHVKADIDVCACAAADGNGKTGTGARAAALCRRQCPSVYTPLVPREMESWGGPPSKGCRNTEGFAKRTSLDPRVPRMTQLEARAKELRYAAPRLQLGRLLIQEVFVSRSWGIIRVTAANCR